MASCIDCGSWIPDGQNTCSMCYGDMEHGRDGYYRAWAEQQDEKAQEERNWDAEMQAAVERGEDPWPIQYERNIAEWTKQEDEILAADKKNRSDRTEGEYAGLAPKED